MRVFEWFKHRKAVLVTAVGYAAAAAAAVSVLIYLTFPWEKLSDWLRVRVERATALEISVQKSRVQFPFVLVWSGVTVSRAGGASPIRLAAEKISVDWPLGAVLRRRWDLDITLRAFGGEARGRLEVRRTALGVKCRLEGNGGGFDLAKLAGGLSAPSSDLSGTIQVHRIRHDWMNADWSQGQGELRVEAANVEIRRWETRFARMSGNAVLKGGMGNLENISVQGEALDLVGSGSLLLRPDLMDSLLNFNSRITLRKPSGPLAMLAALAAPDGRLDFAVRGVLRRPTAFVNGTAFGALPFGADRSGEPPRPGTVEPGGSRR